VTFERKTIVQLLGTDKRLALQASQLRTGRADAGDGVSPAVAMASFVVSVRHSPQQPSFRTLRITRNIWYISF
jgi:hypothetical protein